MNIPPQQETFEHGQVYEADVIENICPFAAFWNRIPLFAAYNTVTWSLINLALSILGILLVIMMIIKNASYRPEDDHSHTSDRAAGIITIKLSNDRSYNFTPLAGAIILSLLALLFFAVISDLRTSMVLLNIWSILHAIVFIAVCVLCKMTHSRNDDIRDDAIDFDAEYENNLTHSRPAY